MLFKSFSRSDLTTLSDAIAHAKAEALAVNKDRPFRVGLTSGVYDLFHYYHLYYLERCRQDCDFLIVGVDADLLVKHFKNKVPVFSENYRAAIVAGLKATNAAFVMHSVDQFEKVVSYCGVDIIFKNHPELYGEKIRGAEHAEVKIIPDVDDASSTSDIIRKIQRALERPTTGAADPGSAEKAVQGITRIAHS